MSLGCRVPCELLTTLVASGIGVELLTVDAVALLVEDVVALLAGEPGIGKSTLLLQSLAHYQTQGTSTLYVSGEESASQIALRADRLNVLTTHAELEGMGRRELFRELLAACRAQGVEFVGSKPQEFQRHVAIEVEKWAQVVRASGARVD